MTTASFWMACSSGSSTGEPTEVDASGGTFPGGGENGAGVGSGGVAGSGGISGGTGDSSTGGSSDPRTAPPYEDLDREDDVSTAPVADCTGQPDMTLCSVETTPDRWYDICVAGTCVSPGCGDMSCNAPAPHFRIPPTSHHLHLERDEGLEPVVIDLVTGLHFQGCNAGSSGNDCSEGAPLELDWDAALAYCDALSWAGHDDWYLPDAYEALSILDFAGTATDITRPAALDSEVFPNAGRSMWTSHYRASGRGFLLTFGTAGGFSSSTFRAELTLREEPVRCVRRGFSRDAGFSEERFAVDDSHDTLVTDRATGLMWQGCPLSGSSRSCRDVDRNRVTTEWHDYCAELNYAGFSDWRLPAFKEAQSLLSPGGTEGFTLSELFDSSSWLASWSGNLEDPVLMLLHLRTANKTGPSDIGRYPIACVRP